MYEKSLAMRAGLEVETRMNSLKTNKCERRLLDPSSFNLEGFFIAAYTRGCYNYSWRVLPFYDKTHKNKQGM